METNDTIHVLYNIGCGGWRPSDKAIQLYNQQMKKIIPSYESRFGIYSSSRHDPMLLDIYYDLGEEFDGHNSITKIKVLPIKYSKYYFITHNNGIENVNVDIFDQSHVKYKLYEILKSSMTNDEKISELNKLYLIDY
jgi:hypothetical protein